jgi:hypothetical protein
MLLQPVKTLHQGDIWSEGALRNGVLGVHHELLQLPCIGLGKALILGAQKWGESRVRKIWRQHILRARGSHSLLRVLIQRKWSGKFLDRWSLTLYILEPGETEAYLTTEILQIFDLLLRWLIISVNRASINLLIPNRLLKSHSLSFKTPDSGGNSQSLCHPWLS